MKRNNKNKIDNNKDIIFKDNLHENTLVTCKNQQSSQPISISSRIIPLSTPTTPNQTQVQSKATAQKLSHAQVAKQVTSTSSIHCNKLVDDDEKRRAHESHSENPISSNNTSIATFNVQPLQVKSSSIEYSSPLFFLLESPRSNANTVTEHHILDIKHPLHSNAKDTSSYCVDEGLLTIDNGDTLDSHKYDYSCANISAITTFTEPEVGFMHNIYNPTTLLGSTSSTAYTPLANKIDSLPPPYNKHSFLTFLYKRLHLHPTHSHVEVTSLLLT